MRTTKIAFRRRRAEILRFAASKAFRSAAAISSIECVDAGFTVGSRLFEASLLPFLFQGTKRPCRCDRRGKW